MRVNTGTASPPRDLTLKQKYKSGHSQRTGGAYMWPGAVPGRAPEAVRGPWRLSILAVQSVVWMVSLGQLSSTLPTLHSPTPRDASPPSSLLTLRPL